MAALPSNTSPISELGEQELIRRFFGSSSQLNKKTVLGIGDDCAVLETGSEDYQLISTDQLLEETHFLKSLSSPGDIGHKAAAVNFSDIAAMGGQPTGILLSLGLPPSTTISWLSDFADGFNGLCEEHDVPLLGGDTTRATDNIAINVTVLGSVNKKNIKFRADAEPGDVVCITGTLGDAAAGLQLLQESEPTSDSKSATFLAQRYKAPSPAIKQGEWLGDQSEVHAMIDLSDGLATDGTHICERSNAEIHIDVEQVPLSSAFKKYISKDNSIQKELALGGGEDYHLLCTVSPEAYEDLNNSFNERFGTTPHQIGAIKEGNSRVHFFEDGNEIEAPQTVYEHFKQNK